MCISIISNPQLFPRVARSDHHHLYCIISGMRIRIRSDPLIFGPPDPDRYYFHWIRIRILPVTKRIYKIIFILNKIYPASLIYIIIFFSRIKDRSGSDFFLLAEPDSGKTISDPHPWKKYDKKIVVYQPLHIYLNHSSSPQMPPLSKFI